jgi:hypothetical protein
MGRVYDIQHGWHHEDENGAVLRKRETTGSIPMTVQESSDWPGRLVASGYAWKPEDACCCVHGIKLRWQCDWCDEYFGKE